MTSQVLIPQPSVTAKIRFNKILFATDNHSNTKHNPLKTHLVHPSSGQKNERTDKKFGFEVGAFCPRIGVPNNGKSHLDTTSLNSNVAFTN
jgi:hypothetical protein